MASMARHAFTARAAATLIAVVLGVTPARAQEIRVGENVRVAKGLETRPLVEPHLAVHPSDSKHLLAATIVSDPADAWGDSQTCSSFLSIDGGQSWERHDFAITSCGDPWVAITPAGRAVFIALGKHEAVGDRSRMGLVAFHSPDGGRTWNDHPTAFGVAFDHPMAAVDAASPDRADWIYLASTRGLRQEGDKERVSVFVTRSTDGGKTFAEPVTVIPSNLNLSADTPALLSDGTLIVPFSDFQRNVRAFKKDLGMLERRRSWVLRSTDGGRTFSTPLFASESCVAGWTALAADTGSGEFRDRLYFACRQRGAGTLGIHSSSDRGETWSDAVRVQVPTAGRVDHPAMAVNRAGVVGLAWIETHVPASIACHEVHFTVSLDGGRTFLPARRVSSGESCPSAVNGAAAERWARGGDYFGLVAAPDGRFHVLWSDARDRFYQLWTAAIDVTR